MILLLKLTLVFMLGIAATGMRRGSASTRFLLGLTALLCAPGVVVLHTLLPAVEPLELPIPVIDPGQSLSHLMPAMVQSLPQLLASESSMSWPDVDTLLVWGYLAVAGLLLMRLLIHIFAAQRWVASGCLQTNHDTPYSEVPLVLLAGASSPFTWGLLRPVIVVPVEWANWTAERRQMVLLHESAHIRRGDLFWALTARFLCALFWFHPCVWWLAARLRHEAERACDDAVLMRGVEASDYAEELLKITRFTRPQVAPAVASKSKLYSRISALLDTDRRRMPMKSWQIWVTAVATVTLLVPVASLNASSDQKLSAGVKQALQAAHDELSQYHFERGEQSVEALLESTELSAAERGQAYNMLGYAHYLQNEVAAAIAAYQKVVAAKPHIPEGLYTTTLYTLAQLEFVQENHAAALEYLDEWFNHATTPGSQPSVFRGKVLLALERYEEALQMVEQGIEQLAAQGRAAVPPWEQLRDQLNALITGGEAGRAMAEQLARNQAYVPIVKVGPIYPAEAMAQGVEGYVVVEFSVTAAGDVAEPRVVDAHPERVFDDSALLAASKFKYKPQQVDGVATPVHGVRNRITFSLGNP